MSTIRLNKYLAQHLAIGRRQADLLIEQGKVQVDGAKPILGAQINPATQRITVRGEPLIAASSAFTYLALHKPVGYVCSRRQQGNTPTIYALLPHQYHHLKPVGRLDKDSSGLLLLTNDGDFAHRMTHPSFSKTKQYLVTLDKPLGQADQQRVTTGIALDDGSSRLKLQQQKDTQHWLITMHEGRNRQIRRTFAALGYRVITLHRIVFGDYQLGTLAPAQYEQIDKSAL